MRFLRLNLTPLLGVFCLAVVTAAQEEHPVITVPKGAALEFDGRVDAVEWRDAAKFVAERGGVPYSVRLKRVGGWLAVAATGGRAYDGELLDLTVADGHGALLVSVTFGIGRPVGAPVLVRRGVPDEIRKAGVPGCMRQVRTRVQVADGKHWSGEWLVRLGTLGIGVDDGRSFLAGIVLRDSAETPLLSVPSTVDPELLRPKTLAKLVSSDRWGTPLERQPVAAEISREFDDNEYLHLLGLEHGARSNITQVDEQVLEPATQGRDPARIKEVLARLNAGRERNPTLPAWVLFTARLHVETNGWAQAEAVITAMPPHWLRRDPFFRLRGDLHMLKGEWDEAVALAGKFAEHTVVAKPYYKRALVGRSRAAAEAKARIKDAARDPANPRVALLTSRGRIVLELFEDQAPHAVMNFMQLAKKRFFEGLRFHVVLGASHVRCGSPASRSGTQVTREGPGWRLRPDPPQRSLVRGAVATVPEPSGAYNGSQFLIAVGPLFSFDEKVTVFGRVVEGMDVLDSLSLLDTLERVEILRRRGHPYDIFEARLR